MGFARTGGPYAEASRRYRERNPEKVKERRRQYYLRHGEKQRAATAAWRSRNPDRAMESVKSYRLHKPAGYLLSITKSRAKVRALDFDLTREWIEQRLPKGCALSGLEFDLGPAKGRGKALSRAPSVDRIDSSKGYLQSNCRLICWSINFALGHWGWDEVAPIFRAALERENEHRGVELP